MSTSPLFTQKHYEYITERLVEMAVPALTKLEVAAVLCRIFEQDNPKFRPSKFLEPLKKETEPCR